MSARDGRAGGASGACRWATVAVGLLAASACSGGSEPALEELSQAEAAQLFSALSAAYFSSVSAPTPVPPAGASGGGAGAATTAALTSPTIPALAPTTTTHTDSAQVTVSCGAGGGVVVTTTDSTTITVDVVLNPSPDTSYVTSSDYSGRAAVATAYMGCGSRDGQGNVWTFDTDDSGLTLQYDMEGTTDAVGFTAGGYESATTLDWDGVWQGTLGWSRGGRSGQCTISMTTESHTTVVNGAPTYSYEQSGQICGLSVSTSVSG